MPESILYLYNPTPSKIDALNDTIVPILSSQGNSYKIEPLALSRCSTPEQPIDQGTEISCFMQLIDAVQYCADGLEDGDKIITIEDGIYQTNDGLYNVFVMMIYDPGNDSIRRYNSYGKKINADHYNKYIEHVMNFDIYQLNQSLQSIGKLIQNKNVHNLENNDPEYYPKEYHPDDDDTFDNINNLPDAFQFYIDVYTKSAREATLEQDIIIGYSLRFDEFNPDQSSSIPIPEVEQKDNQKDLQDNQNIVQFLDCMKKYIIDVSAETKYNERLKLMNKQTTSIIANYWNDIFDIIFNPIK